MDEPEPTLAELTYSALKTPAQGRVVGHMARIARLQKMRNPEMVELWAEHGLTQGVCKAMGSRILSRPNLPWAFVETLCPHLQLPPSRLLDLADVEVNPSGIRQVEAVIQATQRITMMLNAWPETVRPWLGKLKNDILGERNTLIQQRWMEVGLAGSQRSGSMCFAATGNSAWSSAMVQIVLNVLGLTAPALSEMMLRHIKTEIANE